MSSLGLSPQVRTSDVGVVIADEVVTALEAREELRAVAFNLKGAFDRVWWNNLLAHLWAAGIRSTAFKLIHSYLSERSLGCNSNGK